MVCDPGHWLQIGYKINQRFARLHGGRNVKDKARSKKDDPAQEQLVLLGKILGEIRLLQRWGGGDAVPRDQIFGLLNGFELSLQEELRVGISDQLRERVEDVLEAVEAGKQSPESMAIKQRLAADRIDEVDAATVMQLCLLQSRFTDAINKVGIRKIRTRDGGIETQSFGANHYLELVDPTEGAKKRAAFCATVPRVGEIITPQAGSPMRVDQVEYVAIEEEDSLGVSRTVLIPHVHLVADDDDDDERYEA
jgi:hypothetical protein